MSVISLPSSYPILLTGLFMFLLTACDDALDEKPEYEGQSQISGEGFNNLLKSCAIQNGGPVFPVTQYTLNKIVESIDTKRDTDEEVARIYEHHKNQMLELTLAKLNQCMEWEDGDPVDEGICIEFLRCQDELVASNPLHLNTDP